MTVRENLTLAALPRSVPARHRQPRRAAEDRRSLHRPAGHQDLGTRAEDSRAFRWQPAKSAARALALPEPALLLLDEPTRGIDVGAKAEIQGLIDELADDGLGVLMISSELEEITEGADRVVVLREGRTVAEFDQADVSQDTVMHAMAHGADEPASRQSADRRSCKRWPQHRRPRQIQPPGPASDATAQTTPLVGYPARLRLVPRAGGAGRLQHRLHPELSLRGHVQRESDSGRDDRHRRGRNDLRHCHWRDRSLGRIADGHCRCAGADVSARWPTIRGARGGLGAGDRRAADCDDALRSVQRHTGHGCRSAADHRYARALSGWAWHRAVDRQRRAARVPQSWQSR